MMPHALEGILNCFPAKPDLWSTIHVAATFPKFWIKRRKRELAMEICLCFGQLPQSTKCNPSKTRRIKNFDVNDETRFGNYKIWLLHSQTWQEGPRVPVSTIHEPEWSLQVRMKSWTIMHNPVHLQAPHWPSTSHKAAEYISKLHLLLL